MQLKKRPVVDPVPMEPQSKETLPNEVLAKEPLTIDNIAEETKEPAKKPVKDVDPSHSSDDEAPKKHDSGGIADRSKHIGKKEKKKHKKKHHKDKNPLF